MPEELEEDEVDPEEELELLDEEELDEEELDELEEVEIIPEEELEEEVAEQSVFNNIETSLLS